MTDATVERRYFWERAFYAGWDGARRRAVDGMVISGSAAVAAAPPTAAAGSGSELQPGRRPARPVVPAAVNVAGQLWHVQRW